MMRYLRIKLVGWYCDQIIKLAIKRNTTPTQIIKKFINNTATAQDAKDVKYAPINN